LSVNVFTFWNTQTFKFRKNFGKIMTVVKNFRRPFSLDIFYGLWLSCEAGLSLARLRRASESEVSRIFSKIGSDFNQNTPPIYTRRVFRLAPPKAGLGFGKDFERIFAFCQNCV